MIPGVKVPEDFKGKSFWEKPEGTTGMVITAIIVAGGLGLLALILPFLITLASNLLTFGLLAVALFAFVTVLVKTRTTFMRMLNYVSRSITSWWMTIDPIGILEEIVQDVRDSKKKIDQQVRNLAGVMRQLKTLMESNAKDVDNLRKLASQASKQGNRAQLTLKSRKAGRLEESNMSYQKLSSTLEMLYRVLQKMQEAADFYIEDIEDQAQQAKITKAAIDQAYSAMAGAFKLITGGSSQQQEFDRTMEYLANDYGMKLGEIENMIDMSQNFISTMDLQNSVFDAEAMDKVKEWEEKADSIILGDDKQRIIDAANDERQSVDLTPVSPKPAPEPDDNNLLTLFRK